MEYMYTESQSGSNESAADGQSAPEDNAKPDLAISMEPLFSGSSGGGGTSVAAEVDSILSVQRKRKRNHEVMVEGNTPTEGGIGKMPRKGGERQSILQAVMAWTKTLDDIFLKPAPEKNSPNISDKDTMVGLESTGKLLIPTGHADAVDDISKGEVDQGKKPTYKHWDQRLEELRAYKDRTGNANPPKTPGIFRAEFGLAGWLSGRRTQFRKGKMEKEKVDQLLALGCTGFDGSLLKKNWDQRLEELRAYKERTGHANPKKTQGSSKADLELANWLINKRCEHRGGKMENEKAKQLLALGCTGFDETKPHNLRRTSWDQHFEELKVYKKRTSHANPRITKGASEPDKKLAKWLNSQRVKVRRGQLETEKVKQLFALGCTGLDGSTPPNQYKIWDQRFEELKAYKDRTGDANPRQAQRLPKADLALANWLRHQRYRFQEGKLEKEKVDQLLALGCTGFDGSLVITPVKPWHQRFEELKAYKDKNGHANPPKTRGLPKADLLLAQWLNGQRVQFRKGKLEKEKVDLLLALGCTRFDGNKIHVEAA